MSIFKTSEFATQSLKSLPTLCLIIKENQQMNYLLYFLLEKKLFLVTIMTFNEQCNNRCSLHFNTKWMCKKKKSIMNFSESKQNRSRENREKSKNRFFFPPLLSDYYSSCFSNRSNTSRYELHLAWNTWRINKITQDSSFE